MFNLGQVFPVLTAGFDSVTLTRVITEKLTLLLFSVKFVIKLRSSFRAVKRDRPAMPVLRQMKNVCTTA